MYQHILIPLDGSKLAENILPHVIAMARCDNSALDLIQVLEPLGREVRWHTIDPLDWQIRKAEAETYIQDVADRLKRAGFQATPHVLEGKAAESLLDWIHEHHIDLVAMSSHGQSGISGWNISSVVQKVILRANISFLIHRAYQPVPDDLQGIHYHRILLPLDGSPRAESVLPIAEAIARAHQGQLIVVHVVQKPEMPRRIPLSQEEVELVHQVTDKNQQEAEKYLADLDARLDMETQTQLMVSDSVADSLREIESEEGIDLVIVSAHGYTGSQRWPFGSEVVNLIAYGTKPLLVVQDLPKESIQPSPAEIAARQVGDR